MDKESYIPKSEYLMLLAEKQDLENQLKVMEAENPILSMSDDIKYGMLQMIREFQTALKIHGPYNSYHEALGVIREEYLELEQEIFKKPSSRNSLDIILEARQLCACTFALMIGMLKK